MLPAPIVVGVGGFLGSAGRYLAGRLVGRVAGGGFPLDTLLVNASGCLAIGFLGVLVEERGGLGPAARLFWMVGVLGGYTTFSTFGYETVALARDAGLAAGAANVAAQVGLGLLGVWGGAALARGLA